MRRITVTLQLLAALTTGCSWVVDPKSYDRAQDLCSANGGVVRFATGANFFIDRVTCANGANFKMTRDLIEGKVE